MEYTIIQEDEILKRPCHIHCMKIEYLEWFSEWLPSLESYFNIIVTFSFFDNIDDITSKYNYTFLKVKNKGADIGPKFIVCKYLNDKSIDYTHILLLHSKSNTERRNLYLSKLLKSWGNIKELSEYFGNGVFPDILQYGQQPIESIDDIQNVNPKMRNWGRNEYHVGKLQDYLGIRHRDYFFTEGNFALLSKRVFERIYNHETLYLMLNDEKSFDLNWVCHYYVIKHYSEDKVFDKFRRRKLYGNNFAVPDGERKLPDCMIEHAFERVTFNLIKDFENT